MKRTSIFTMIGAAVIVLLGIASDSVLMFAQEEAHANHATPARLVQQVRQATRQFLDVNSTGPAGYGPAFGCVTGPDHGAMGIHYVNGALVAGGEINVAQPQ